MNSQIVKFNGARTIVYCRSNDRAVLEKQKSVLKDFAIENGLTVREMFLESGDTDSLTYRSLRLRAKYREFDNLLITGLSVLSNSAIEITHEVSFLNENGVKVVSLKDGELNVETLPQIFRKGFKIVT